MIDVFLYVLVIGYALPNAFATVVLIIEFFNQRPRENNLEVARDSRNPLNILIHLIKHSFKEGLLDLFVVLWIFPTFIMFSPVISYICHKEYKRLMYEKI